MKYLKIWFFGFFLFSFVSYSSAQSASDYVRVMNEIGCGNEFSKTIGLPVPLAGYRVEAERRINQAHTFNILGQSPPRTPESIRQVLLFKPINSIDKMNQELAQSEFAYYLDGRNIAVNSDATQFEKSVAVTLLCVFDKRRKMTAEESGVSSKVRSLGDGLCNRYLQTVLSIYPDSSPTQDLLTKMIREGQDSKDGSKSSSQPNFGPYDPSKAFVPGNFISAATSWMSANRYKAQALLQQQRALPLVPSKDEIEKWKLLQLKHDVNIAIANYWVCHRANREGLVKWFQANSNNAIYLSTFDPWKEDYKTERFVWRLYKARVVDANQPTALTLETVASCFSMNGAKNAMKAAQMASKNFEDIPTTSEYSNCNENDSIAKLFSDVMQMHIARKTVLLGPSYEKYSPQQ